MKFIEALKEIKSLLGACANIGAMNKIDKTITEYQLEVEEFDKWARHIPKPEHLKKGITVTCTTIPQTISDERIWDLSNQELFRKKLNCYKFIKPSKKAEA